MNPSIPLNLLPLMRDQKNKTLRINHPGHLTISPSYMVSTPKDIMEIPDKIAYPILVGIVLMIAKMFFSARSFFRPRVPDNGNGERKRLSIEEMFEALHADITDIKTVKLEGINTRLGRIENRVHVLERDL